MRVSLLLLGLTTFVHGHSWLHCTDYRGSVETYEPEKCFANPRPKGGIYPQQGTFGLDRGFDTQSGVCQSNVIANNAQYPSAELKRGQTIRLAWPSKNHVAAACTNAFIPDTSLRLYVTEQTANPTLESFTLVPASFSEDPHENGKIDGKGFQNCPRFCDNMDKSLCTGTFVVPQWLDDGNYSFQWRWVFNRGTAPYVACFEATVQGNFDGSTDPVDPAPTTAQPPATTAQPPVTTSAPATTTNAPAPSPQPTNCSGPWGQCGGGNWAGPSCCQAGLVCYEQSEWYAQCLRPNTCPPHGWSCNIVNPPTTAPATTTAAPATTAAPPATTAAPPATTAAPPATTAAPPATTAAPPATTTPATTTPATTTQATSPPGTTATDAPVVAWEGIAGTTRYWDCCKPSCSWPSNVGDLAAGHSSVRSCTKDGSDGDPNAVNVCGGGGDATKDIVYSCPDNQPFTIGDVMYGFAAAGGPLSGCCACYELEFTDFCTAGCAYQGQLEGRRMVVQVTNTGSDLGNTHFDLQIPGGGFGIFNGCSPGEQGTNGPSQFEELTSKWGQRFGGVTSEAQCNGLPSELKAGCDWRFNDFLNSDNPAVKYRQVKCPAVLTEKSGCRLANEPSTEAGSPTGEPATTSTPVTTDASPQPPVGCSDEFGQCGGSSWTGSTCCKNDLVCYKEHDHYSQCRTPGSCPTGWACDDSTTASTTTPVAPTTSTGAPATTTKATGAPTTSSEAPFTTTKDPNNCVCTCDAPVR